MIDAGKLDSILLLVTCVLQIRVNQYFGSYEPVEFQEKFLSYPFNRYWQKLPKVDANIFDSALSHTRRSDASEKREENRVFTFGRFRKFRVLACIG